MSDTNNLLTTAFGERGIATLTEEVALRYSKLADRMAGKSSPAFEEVESHWSPAIVRIVQAMSSAKSGRPDTAKMGDLYHKGGLVPKPLQAAVVYAWPTRVRFTDEDDGIPSCSSENVDMKGRAANDQSISIYGDKCSACPFDSQPFRYGEATSCNNVMNVLLLPETIEDIYVMQFSKSGWTAGKQLVDLATAKNPPWSRFFSIDTEIVKRKQGGGQYAVPNVAVVGEKEVPDHLQKFADMLCQHFSGYRKTRKEMVLKRARGVGEAVAASDNVARGGKQDKPDFSSGM